MNRRMALAFVSLSLAALAGAQQPSSPDKNSVDALPGGPAVTLRGVTVKNTSPADSGTKAKITAVGSTDVRVSGGNGVHMEVTDAKPGTEVACPNNSVVSVTGTGGHVTLGSGVALTITNNAPIGGASITWDTGNSHGSIPPGSSGTVGT